MLHFQNDVGEIVYQYQFIYILNNGLFLPKQTIQ